jgi:hypothetical protein
MSNTSGGLLAYGSWTRVCFPGLSPCACSTEKQHNALLRELSLALKNLASTLTSDEVRGIRDFCAFSDAGAARAGGAAERVD